LKRRAAASRIAAALQSGTRVVTTRGHVSWVVTGYDASTSSAGSSPPSPARELIASSLRFFGPHDGRRPERPSFQSQRLTTTGLVVGLQPQALEDRMRIHIRPLVLALGCGMFVAAAAARAQTMGEPERFTALAINMTSGTSGTVEIVVNRWSSDADRDKLMNILMNQGADKLLDALQDMPRVGYFRTPNSVGIDVHFARRLPGEDGGERVVLVTDRRIGFWEAANQPRSIDYPFTVIELRLNKDGEGVGKISVATKIIPDRENNIITLENFDIQPVRLNNVKRERVSQ
jgi:hypothetical protein